MKKFFIGIFIILTSVCACKKLPLNEQPLNSSHSSEEHLKPEGSEVEGDNRYAFLSKETTFSDCFIVSHFTDMDITYVTVDFVSYKPSLNSKGEPSGEYEIVNELKTLRTFMVMDSYFTCNGKSKKSINELIERYENEKKTVFTITTTEGVVEELYINDCED